jgi:hypothetical protein
MANGSDAAGPSVRVDRMQLVKWDGEVPAPGETKEPLEIIVCGDDTPTRVLHPGDDGWDEEVRRAHEGR